MVDIVGTQMTVTAPSVIVVSKFDSRATAVDMLLTWVTLVWVSVFVVVMT